MRTSCWQSAAALICLACVSGAQAQSDLCAGATAVGLGAHSFNNTGFGNEGRSPVPAPCGFSGNSPTGDLYYSFTAPSAGTYVFTTCGPVTGTIFDTIIEIYASCADVAAFGPVIACNDDAGGANCGPFGYLSRTTAALMASQTVIIRVMGWNALEVGTGTLYISPAAPPPANDSCANAINVGMGTASFDSTSALNDAATSCGAGGRGRDVFYRFTPAVSGDYVINTCGSGFDTVLAVLDACGGSELACNDDGCGLSSRVLVTLTGGVPYIIQVDGYGIDEGGPGVLNIGVAPPNDYCVPPPLAVSLGSTPFNTTFAANDGGTLCGGSGPDIFFSFTPPSDGEYVIDTCGSSFDTVLGLNNDCFTEVDCNNDSDTVCVGTFQSEIVANLMGGTTYIIRVDGFAGASGTGTLNISLGGPTCDGIDFNNDGLFPDTQDVDDFLSVFGGGPCSTGNCNDLDFNNDGLFPDTQDVDSLLSVFGGGPCL